MMFVQTPFMKSCREWQRADGSSGYKEQHTALDPKFQLRNLNVPDASEWDVNRSVLGYRERYSCRRQAKLPELVQLSQ